VQLPGEPDKGLVLLRVLCFRLRRDAEVSYEK
jgi:hypothetical protein